MIDYSKWKEHRERVSNMFLDPQNPRFSSFEEPFTQNDLINEMIENYEIYKLAKSITIDGYFPEKN